MSEDMKPSEELENKSVESADTSVAEPKDTSADFESVKVDDGSQQEHAQETSVPEWKFKRQYRRTRKAEEEAEMLRKELADARAALDTNGSPASIPQGEAFDAVELTKRIVREAVSSEFKEHESASKKRNTQEEYDKAVQDAADYIRSQKDVISQKEQMEIGEIINEYELNHIPDPQVAAENALKLWRAQKGTAVKSLQKKQAGAIKGSQVSPAEGWTREKVQALASKGGPEWEKNKGSILAAMNKGLVK